MGGGCGSWEPTMILRTGASAGQATLLDDEEDELDEESDDEDEPFELDDSDVLEEELFEPLEVPRVEDEPELRLSVR
ncbi:hypothetical protein Acsp04_52000 [Actinomadura sp. NBRC 104425]|nr:hypothetical protein Acsp04_52000 [Actinomadura sp. NBRC 104425]